ncbi:hypothetical protein MNB_SV-15-779 [hydrothermal vent metagenome]|uniref:Uncharacterized protein n=1 Tax=hydrothermal vent metagenome TaxID=652676 RepID=A0A1W1EHU4_9ZZZZ
MIDFNADFTPKVGMIIFAIGAGGGFIIRRSMKLIIGVIIMVLVATILFLLIYKSGIFNLDQDVANHITDKFYNTPLEKIKSVGGAIWNNIVNTPPSKWHFANYLIAVIGFLFGFGFLGSYFGEPKKK